MNLELGLTMMVVALIGLADCALIYSINMRNNRLLDYMHSEGVDMEVFDRKVAKIMRLRSALRSQLSMHYGTVSFISFYVMGYTSPFPYVVTVLAGWQMCELVLSGSRNADPLCFHQKAYPHYAYLALTSLWLAAKGFTIIYGV